MMTEWAERAKRNMGNPMVLRWLLERYEQIRLLPPDRRSAIEATCFDSASLIDVLRSADGRELERLFRTLPDRLFAPVVSTIAENWPGWTGDVARESAGVLARLEPDIALEVFSAKIHSGSVDGHATEGMVQSLPGLPLQPARNLLRILAESGTGDMDSGTESSTDSSERILLSLLHAAVELDPGLADRLARQYFETFDAAFVEDWVFAPVIDRLFGSSVYFETAGAILECGSGQCFSDLRPFFVEGAPLAELDRQCRIAFDGDALAPLLGKWIEPATWILFETILQSALEGGRRDETQLERQVLVGALAAACARTDLDADTLGLHDCVSLLCADIQPVPHLGKLVRRLQDFPSESVNAALVTALEKNRDQFGGSSVATAMGLIGFGDFVVPLTNAMREEADDFVCREAGVALIRIGPPALNHLMAAWDSLDWSQRLRGRDVIGSVGGEQAVQFALERFDDLMVAEVDTACRLISSLPDPRFIARLEPHLTRGWTTVDEIFHVLTCLYDVEHPQSQAAADRLRQHEANVWARTRVLTGEGLPDGCELPPLPRTQLKCLACGCASMYAVERIALSLSGKKPSAMVAEEFPCLVCERITDFGIPSESSFSLFADFHAQSRIGASGGSAGQRKYLVDRMVWFGDRSWDAVAVIEKCKAALERGHEDVVTLLELGLCYQIGLDRPQYADQFLERALATQPRAVEATFLRAEALLRQKQDEAAIALLEEALAGKESWRFYLVGGGHPSGFLGEFAKLYNRLRLRTGDLGRPPLSSNFLSSRQRIGRNDPCICGSGKKYKKCCLN